MKKGSAKIYIGTSGWVYSHWIGRFYPEDLSPKDPLKFFSKFFNTVEINYSFYHLPRPKTFENWYLQTKKGFLFSVKVSRFITHIKRLKDVKEPWEQFFENAKYLKEKLGPFLFQFPPSFRAEEENIKPLEKFLQLICFNPRKSASVRFAFEFRHKTWLDKKIYNLLKKHKVAWVIADSSRYPKSEVVTSDFVYVRMHGPAELFASKYSEKNLKDLAQKIKKWQKEKKDVFVYFNNDFYGYAVENALFLKKLLKV
ncbi:MAG: DUF72 domain-containing protein [Candidatus Pacebacteria bacterium]|nr:DUF72 domain-containing protein [Candidatus Paceibacterota bacterium]